MFKSLGANDGAIRPFKVYKSFTFIPADSGSNVYALEGLSGSLYNFLTGSAASQSFGIYNASSASVNLEPYSLGTFYKRPLFFSMEHLYYSNLDQPIRTFGGNDTQTEKRELHDRVNVFSIPKKIFGEQINPKSVKILDDSTDATLTLVDDGKGNLYDFQYSSSFAQYVSSSWDRSYLDANGSGSVIGNVFYQHGIVAVTNTGSMYAGVGLGTGTDAWSINFKSEYTIYEHEYVCTINPYEFTDTMNASVSADKSGSITVRPGSNFPVHKFFPPGDNPYGGSGSFASSYEATPNYISAVSHSDFAPYVTSVGLYNDQNQLLAVAKLSHAVKNDPELSYSYIIRFDA